MNQITFFSAAIGLCAVTQFGYSQTANQPDTNKSTRPAGSSVVSVGYSVATKSPGSYDKYDFVPGDTVIFSDSFEEDKNHKSTAHWKSGSAKSMVHTVAGVKVFAFTNASSNKHGLGSHKTKWNGHLSNAFTLEFDNYSKGSGMPYVYFYKRVADADAESGDLGLIRIGSPGGASDEIEYKNHSANVDMMSNFPDEIKGKNYLNKWHHIAIAYKKNEVKVYIDQFKVMDVPNIGFAPGAVGIEAVTASSKKPVMIANFRIANGSGINMTDAKFTDAKIITHGINFNINAASIKPESMGSLNMIAGIMKGNPDLKFEIDGHTDNTGNPAHNLILSQQRADEVKTQLIALGIDSSRLTTKGFGDTKPLSDNVSAEGKANNRRVEFVRFQ